jgi:hypothetical protein
MSEKHCYSPTEFAEKIGISRAGFYKLMKEEKAPAVIIIGGRPKMTEAAGARWLADQEKGQQTQKSGAATAS